MAPVRTRFIIIQAVLSRQGRDEEAIGWKDEKHKGHPDIDVMSRAVIHSMPN